MVTAINTVVAINRLRDSVSSKVNKKTMNAIDYNLDTLLDYYTRILQLALAEVFEVFSVDHFFDLLCGLRTENRVILKAHFLEDGDIEYTYYNFETFRYGTAKLKRFDILRSDYSDDLFLLLGNPSVLEKAPKPGSSILAKDGKQYIVQEYFKASKTVSTVDDCTFLNRDFLVLDIPLKPTFKYEVIDEFPEGFRQTKVFKDEQSIPPLKKHQLVAGIKRTISVVATK